ncbi:xanthine dehydrogenase molybdopterin binding subunit [Kushneria indalinina]|uniref:Xanthine dehydrogenase molybdenum binding subunit apoprotein n=1 Tax=Kushneria indalinina DSM 14324 TaxID=1122140 RepID=A0A3D9DV13_9GAMM|nr:xanthine dehydrogenase molybdopterin binding subunit [Kushneria indalinina]REC94613.1 xanthine dehydrogenase molybdenum binding subunit apoprotein [Kushneria indalinina DSM 14324]
MRKLIQFGSLPSATATAAVPGHDSAIGHVTGQAAYIDDLPGPKGMHHLAVGLSPHSSARVLHMDLSEVRRQPGVIDVITAADIPGHNEVGAVYPGDPLLAEKEVRYAGQMVFAVVADTLYNARCAVAHARIDYHLQTPALDPAASIRAGLTVLPEHIHERPLPAPALDRGAAMSDDTQTSGNVDKALQRAPHVLEGEQFIGGQEHFYLEGQIAQAEALDDNGLRVLTSSQHPSEVQKLVAEVLAMPLHAIVAEVRRMGGGFGGKESQAAALGAMAALAVHRNGCAVRFRLPRADDMQATGKRHPFHNRYRVGFDDTGRLTGADITLIGNCGHSPDLSEGVVDRAMFHADNAYYLGDARVTGHRAMTHTASNTAFRGFGGPQGMMPIEGAMDDIARTLGLDPLDVRKRNLYDEAHCETHYGQHIDQPLIGELIETLEASSDYRTRRREITAFNAKSPVIRKGLALTPVKFGISFTARHLNQAGALLMIYTDGSVLINHGGTEMGQGLHTKVCQVVAKELGIAHHRVRISATRTDKVPNTSPTAASSGADLNAMAARNAAITLRERLVDFAAGWRGLPREQLTLEADGLSAGETRIEWSELIQQAYLGRVSLSATGHYATPEIYYDRKTGRGRPFFYYAWGAAVSEVHMDTLTGEYRVARVDILHDVGDSLNPAIDRGQIEGGFVQGMGWLTTEELRWDAEGHLLTTGPATYKIPACGDAPRDFRVALLEGHPNSQATIYRSKAVGEPPLMLAISVWSALRDAIASLADDHTSPRLDTPATPERVLMACRAIREAHAHDAPSTRKEMTHALSEK